MAGCGVGGGGDQAGAQEGEGGCTNCAEEIKEAGRKEKVEVV